MTRLRMVLVVALLGVLTGATAAMAQDKTGVIEYRQKVMGSIGANMGAIGDIMKYKLPLQGNIKGHAQAINANAKLVTAAFKEKAAEGKTDAKPEVWSNWSKFEQAAGKLEMASAKLADVAGGGDMAAVGDAIKGLGGTCKGCHDDFRKPKEQSYKNK